MERRLQDLTDVEIKALCYDLLAQQQQAQQNLTALNQELVRRNQVAQQNAATQSLQHETRSAVIPRIITSTPPPNLGCAGTV